MDYDEACEAMVTRAEAKAEIQNHGAEFYRFVRECGDCGEYRGQVVLDWLGY